MNNHVTYETALLLKNAGFLQPTTRAGQFWYGKRSAGDSDVGGFCVLIGSEHGDLRFHQVDGEWSENNNFYVFAPTATDILRELGKEFLLNHVESSEAQAFVCLEWAEAGIATIRIVREWVHENPAEACALAWLAQNEKP